MSSNEMPQLHAEPREKNGSRYAARIREEGKLPAVMYGHGKGPVSITVDGKAAWEILHGHSQLINIELAGETESCLIKDVQWNYLGSKIIHMDLARVDLSEEVEVEVALELHGEPAALEQVGAVLNHERNTINVKCRADAIPDVLTLEIADLTTETAKTVADLEVPAGVIIVDEPETVLASIMIVQEMPDPDEEAAEAAGDEPQVIGREDEEEGAGEAADTEKADA